MKKVSFKKRFKLSYFALATLFIVAITAVSCEQDDDAYFNASAEQSELKSGKAVKKGESTITGLVLALSGDAVSPQFQELKAALIHVGGIADLVSLFDGSDQYTVFAPTDDAFKRLYEFLDGLPAEALPGLPEDVNGITDVPAAIVYDVLLYHVTDGRRAANSVLPSKDGQMKNITTLQGKSFEVDKGGNIYTNSDDIADSSIITDQAGVTYNVSASNGIIHVITEVLLPL